jgi:hypothetical protein
MIDWATKAVFNGPMLALRRSKSHMRYALQNTWEGENMGKESEPEWDERDMWDLRAWNWRDVADDQGPIETPVICPLCVSCDLSAMRRWKPGTPKKDKRGEPPIMLACPCCDFECAADELPDYQ